MRQIITQAVFLLLGLSTAVFAVPTGLNSMPTANVLDMGEARFDYEFNGSGKLYVPADGWVYGTQGGLIPGVEGGIDYVGGVGTVYNLKWRLKSDGLLLPALAVGAQNITGGETPQYYVVASKSFLIPSVHAGLMRDANGDLLVMTGAQARLGPVAARVDRINGGTRSRTGMSVAIRLDDVTITGTLYDFDEGPNQRTITLSYNYLLFSSR